MNIKEFKSKIIKTFIVTIAFLFFISFAFTCWKIEKYVNYKFSYASQVQIEILPLKEDVKNLNNKIEKLEYRIKYLEDRQLENIK